MKYYLQAIWQLMLIRQVDLLIYTKKNSGPSMVPWGTQALMWLQLQDCLLKTTLWNLSLKNDGISPQYFLHIPKDFSLYIRFSCHTLECLGRPLSPLIMTFHRKFHRFHVLLEINDEQKSHQGEIQIGSCLVVCWCLRIRKENGKQFSQKH